MAADQQILIELRLDSAPKLTTSEGTVVHVIDHLDGGYHSVAYRGVVVVESANSQLRIGDSVVVKIPRFLKYKENLAGEQARLYTIDEHNEFAGDMTRKVMAEIEAGRELSDVKEANPVLESGMVPNDCLLRMSRSAELVTVQFSIQRHAPGLTLEQAIRQFGQVTSATVFLTLAKRIAEALREIHRRGTVHGDVRQNNIILLEDEARPWFERDVVFIDFANSSRSWNKAPNQIEAKHHNIDGDSIGDVQGDIFSYGYVLLHIADKSPAHGPLWSYKADRSEGAHQISGDVPDKRPLRDLFSQHNPNLLKENAGIVDIIARSLWKPPKGYRYNRMDSILADIDTFIACASPGVDAQPRQTINKINLRIADDYPLLASIIDYRLQLPYTELQEWEKGLRVNLYGGHHQIIAFYCHLVASLGPGDCFLTYSVSHFWNEHNMGVDGRFFTSNVLAAQAGAVIQRLFYLGDHLDVEGGFNNCSPADASFTELLKRQAEWLQMMDSFGLNTSKRMPINGAEGGFYTGVLLNRAPRGQVPEAIIKHGDMYYGVIGVYSHMPIDRMIGIRIRFLGPIPEDPGGHWKEMLDQQLRDFQIDRERSTGLVEFMKAAHARTEAAESSAQSQAPGR